MLRLLIMMVFFLPITSHGKDLTSRLGVGFRNAYSIDLPSVAAVYYPNALTGVVGSLGIDTKDQASRSAFLAGVRRVVFQEENMNFFMGGNLAFISEETAGDTQSGFELSAIVGGEFFLQGLESLGFNFETGVGVTNVDKVRFRTIGDHLFRAGAIFYF